MCWSSAAARCARSPGRDLGQSSASRKSPWRLRRRPIRWRPTSSSRWASTSRGPPPDMRPPLLYAVHRFPYPPDKGDRIRTFNLLRFLSRHAAVHLACLADEPVDERALTALKRYCERVEVVPVGSRTRWLRALRSFALGKTISEGAFESPLL